MLNTIKKFTNGGYAHYTEYSQYLTDVSNMNTSVDTYEEYQLPNVTEQEKADTVELMNLIKQQPVNTKTLYRVERISRYNHKFEVGETIKFGIRSTTRDGEFADKAYAGDVEGFQKYAEWVDEKGVKVREFIFHSSKALDISDNSEYDQQEELICGEYEVTSVDYIEGTKDRFETETRKWSEFISMYNLETRTFIAKKSGKERIAVTLPHGVEQVLTPEDLEKVQTLNIFKRGNNKLTREVYHLKLK